MKKRRLRKDALADRRRARFVALLLADPEMSATKAAEGAGYSKRSAHVTGSRLLSDVKVRAALADAQAKRVERTHFDQDRVLEEIAVLAFSDVRHYTVNDAGDFALAVGAPDSAMHAVASVKHTINCGKDGRVYRTVEFRLWDKPSTLKLAAVHVGIPKDRPVFTADVSMLSEEQLARLANGEDPFRVLGSSRGG